MTFKEIPFDSIVVLKKCRCYQSKANQGQMSHSGMLTQASAQGSLQVLKHGLMQDSYLH